MCKKICVLVLASILFVFMFSQLGYSFVYSMLPGNQEKWEYVENNSLLGANAAGVEGRETLSNRVSSLVSLLNDEGELMFVLFAPEGVIYFDLAQTYFVNIKIDSAYSFEVKGMRLTTADYMLIMFLSDEVIEAMKTGNEITMKIDYRRFVFTLNGSEESLSKITKFK